MEEKERRSKRPEYSLIRKKSCKTSKKTKQDKKTRQGRCSKERN